ncbi:hypothetical protein [Xanthovirga aplysinae]|uniref:hypothetical protein n=1 Tax=Xanthovirga aplysinae TaxID=2529853 RepID=UPI0012BC0738|nr:hypothetical protein [Xanthovirga aplysinae]MTI30422.1 hypothetical protein [Xanthovirga aplysinae]
MNSKILLINSCLFLLLSCKNPSSINELKIRPTIEQIKMEGFHPMKADKSKFSEWVIKAYGDTVVYYYVDPYWKCVTKKQTLIPYDSINQSVEGLLSHFSLEPLNSSCRDSVNYAQHSDSKQLYTWTIYKKQIGVSLEYPINTKGSSVVTNFLKE